MSSELHASRSNLCNAQLWSHLPARSHYSAQFDTHPNYIHSWILHFKVWFYILKFFSLFKISTSSKPCLMTQLLKLASGTQFFHSDLSRAKFSVRLHFFRPIINTFIHILFDVPLFLDCQSTYIEKLLPTSLLTSIYPNGAIKGLRSQLEWATLLSRSLVLV